MVWFARNNKEILIQSAPLAAFQFACWKAPLPELQLRLQRQRKISSPAIL